MRGLPVHYEGWGHFQEGRAEVERAFAVGPEAVRRALRWLPMGERSDLGRVSATTL